MQPAFILVFIALLGFFFSNRIQTLPASVEPAGVPIRVLLSYRYGAGGFDNQYAFPELPISPSEPVQVRSGGSRDVLQPIATLEPGQTARFSVSGGQPSLSYQGQIYSLGSLTVLDALVPESAANLRFRIENLQRGRDPVFMPEYPGTLTLSLYNNRLLAINEVDFQEYLRRVVISEMPNTYHLEALKAQAVAARSYAYSRLLAQGKGNFWKQFGADVDDSVSEQVYNNQPTDPLTDQAVQATRNQILSFNNQPVQTYFYSTSPGQSVNVQDLWPDNPPTPYLVGMPQSDTTPTLNDEAAALAFFKDWNAQGYDQASPYFRWKISIGREQLERILSRTLPERSRSSPRFVQTPVGKLSPDAAGFSLGTLEQIRIVGRSGPFVTMLEIQTTTGTYRIGRESNLRSLFRPNKEYAGEDLPLERLKAEPRLGFSALPSAAFALEANLDASGKLQSLTFWGGGYGHGVGMSQAGADGLGKLGKTYPEILQHYYPQSTLQELKP